MLLTLAAAFSAEPNPADEALQGLVRAVKAHDSAAVLRSLRIVRRAGAAGVALPRLVELLQTEKDSRVRALARLSLARLGSAAPESVAALRQAMGAKDPAGRLFAAVGFSWVAPDEAAAAVPILRVGLTEAREEFRQEAAFALVQLGTAARVAVPQLTTALEDKAVSVQGAAAFALGQIGADARDALPALRKALRSEDAGVAALAAGAVQAIAPDKAEGTMPVLLRGLTAKEDWGREATILALGDAAPTVKDVNEVFTVLRTGLKDTNVDVRRAAALALARYGSAADKEVPLVRIALKDTDPGVRVAAADALSYLDPRHPHQSVAALRDGLGADDEVLRAEAAEVLGRLGGAAAAALPDLIRGLADEEPTVRMHIAVALGRIGERRAGAALRAALRDVDPGVRALSATALGLVDPGNAREGVPALRGGLGHENARVRQESALGLGRLGADARDALPELRKALRDKIPEVRAATAISLSILGAGPSKEVVAALREGVVGKDDSFLRRESAQALGRLGSAAVAAIPDLVAALKDDDFVLRANSAVALARIDPVKARDDAVPALIDQLRQTDPDGRETAILALGQMGELARPAISALCEAIQAREPEVRLNAIIVLGQLGPMAHKAVPDLIRAVNDPDAAVATQAVGSLLLIDLTRARQEKKSCIPALVKGLRNGNPLVRGAAATALSMFGPDVGEATEAALTKALEDEDKAVALSAASSLALLHPAKAKEVVLPTLIEGLRNPYAQFRRAAAAALAQLGPSAREAARALTEALGDTDVRVHTEAAKALMAVTR